MNFVTRHAFEKDADKLPINIKIRLVHIIEEISRVEKLSDLQNCKKLIGHRAAYRIKLNRYRIGFYFQNNTIELVRVLDRKNI